MFGINDKIGFVISGAKNIRGENVNLLVNIPTKVENILIPDEVAEVRFFEYHEDINEWESPFGIYIGKKSTLEKACKELVINNKPSKIDNKRVDFNNSRSIVVYKEEENGVVNIYNTITDFDKVVNNKEEMIETIKEISEHIYNINDEIKKVKTYNINLKNKLTIK